MSEQTVDQTQNTAGLWVGWIAIIIGVIGFFWQPVWMGLIALIMGIIGVFTPQKTLNGIAIAIGAIALLIAMI